MLTSDELKLVQEVYDEIIGMEWFVDDGQRKSDFGAALIRAFEGGNRNRYKLREHGLEIASRDFSKTER